MKIVCYTALICLTTLSLTGCAVKRMVTGEVAHQVVSCTKSEDCKDRMAKDCPNGGMIYSIRPSVTVEYSCS
jgi:hypothetical protein